MNRFFQISMCVVALAAGTITAANGQDMLSSNLQFDAMMQSQMNAMQQQLNNSQAQFWQTVRQDPNVQAGYQQHRAQGGQYSYEQYCYWYAMTAGGTNYQGALDAQRRQFEGLQQAHRTVQEGYNNYNHGYWQNQARLDGVYQRYSDGANRGNWYYTNPYSGTTYTLPYTNSPGYYNDGTNTFYVDGSGQYYMYSGSGWTQLNMNR